MITGRGPGAPGITPGLEFTGRPGSPGGTEHEAVDLSEIRRSEDLIDRLAARTAGGARPRPGAVDPAAALLAALTADVDAPAAADQLAGRRARPPRRAAAGPPPAGAPSRGLGAWLRTAATGAVVAGLAGSMSLLTASMLARLSRGMGTRGRMPSRGWAQPGPPRRCR